MAKVQYGASKYMQAVIMMDVAMTMVTPSTNMGLRLLHDSLSSVPMLSDASMQASDISRITADAPDELMPAKSCRNFVPKVAWIMKIYKGRIPMMADELANKLIEEKAVEVADEELNEFRLDIEAVLKSYVDTDRRIH